MNNIKVRLYHLVLVWDTDIVLTQWPMPHRQCMTMKRKMMNPVNVTLKESNMTDWEREDDLPSWIKEYIRIESMQE